jgi:hypothetical protein
VSPSDRRPVPLAGLGLIGSDAVLGLAPRVPAAASPDAPRRISTPVNKTPVNKKGPPGR